MRLKVYAPAGLWGAFLLFLGGRSDVPTVETDLPLDKAAHFLLYGLLGLLAARGWLRAGRWPAAFWPLLAALLIGAADELNQRSVEGRSSEMLDLAADAAGIGVGFAWVILHEKRRRQSP